MNIKGRLLRPFGICIILVVLFTGFKTKYSDYPKLAYSKYSSLTDTIKGRECFLVISDIHLNSEKKQAFADGDSGYDLWDSAKKQISAILNKADSVKPKFLLVLGDLPFHVNGKLDNINDVRNSFDSIYRDLASIAKAANTPLIIAPGNNDSYDGDYHAINSAHAVDLFYPAAQACFADHSLYGMGCYSIYPLGKDVNFRLVILNTVIFASPNNNKIFSYGTNKQSDATLEMAWLRTQLQEAADKNEKTLIAMHIPPGNDGYPANTLPAKYLWDSSITFEGRILQNAFLDIIDSFKNNITGLLGSHSHMDGIRLLMKNDSTISSLLISVPAIDPGHHNNPSMKLVIYNPLKSFELEDFVTYYMKYWYNNKPGEVKNFGDYYTFKNEFHSFTDTSMLANIREEFNTDKAKLSGYVDSIYSVKNGLSGSFNNNAAVTIYVTKQ